MSIKRTKGFTMIELIVVIILLGILGVMSTDIISHTYRNYLYQKEVADLQSRSKQLLDQLSGYLEQAIMPSMACFDGVNHLAIGGGVRDANRSNGHYLEWIGKDTESLQGIWNGSRVYPGYSGFANVRDSNSTWIITPDCNLSYVNTIQADLTGEPDIVNGGKERAALYFVNANSEGDVSARFWSNPVSLFNIAGLDDANGIITLDRAPPEIGEHYYLSYSAYGIQLENDGTMYLYRNFRPWNGENIGQSGIERHVIMQDVADFVYWSESEDSILRFRVCLQGEDAETVFCKEAVVLR